MASPLRPLCRRAVGAVLGASLFAATLSACGETVIEDTASTTTVAPASTTLPSGPPEVLLPRLVDTLETLSEAIIDDGDQAAIIAEADALWAATRPDVTQIDAKVADDIEALMAQARLAVERRRPADADKSAKFLAAVVENLLARA